MSDVSKAVTRWFYETFDDELLQQMEDAGIISQAEGFSLSMIATLKLAVEEAESFDEAAERAAAHQSFEEQMPIMCNLDEFTAGYLACAKRKSGVK